MKYFDEMRTKFGFGDGGSVPPDAQAGRTVYVEALSQVAAKLGSEPRAYAYDRPGVHNPFLIVVLETRYGQVWDTLQLADNFEVLEFAAPFAVVKRKADHQIGSLMFQHHPRYYF